MRVNNRVSPSPVRKLSRRDFLKGCSAGIAALAGARLTQVAFAAQDPAADIFVLVFLSGGWDALNVVPPLAGDDRRYYEKARPTIKIAEKSLLQLDDRFGLHPALAPLYELYQDGYLGIVHAVGLNVDTRSHFDATELIELGTPESKATTSGWLTRHLQTLSEQSTGLLPAIALPFQTTSLLGYAPTVSMSIPSELAQWDNGFLAEQQAALRKLYAGGTLLHQVGERTLDAVQVVSPLSGEDYEYRPSHGARYPDDDFGRQLATVAQMIKLNAGLQVATVEFGGWDTHEDQNYGNSGYLTSMLESLAEGLANFYRDVEEYADRLSVVVMSEFGRRLAQNDADGTDHGHGSVILALGKGVNGGKVYGQFPGLHNDQLYDHADLAVTTDFRAVLSEVLRQRLANPRVDVVFPDYRAESPLGLFRPA
jgi:uncharacterized protein (DUF1501 family)